MTPTALLALTVAARDALEHAAWTSERADDPDVIRLAWLNARTTQRDARHALEGVTDFPADVIAQHEAVFAKGEAMCDKAIAQLQADIPYHVG